VEQARQVWEERYHILVELCPDFVSIIVEGKIASINQAGMHLLGATRPEQLVGKPLLDLVAPDSRDGAAERFRGISAGAKFGPVEEKWTRFDGTAIDVEVIAETFTLNNRTALQFIARDVTERKQTEAMLRESQTRHSRLTELYLDLIGVEAARTAELQTALRRAREVDELKSKLLAIVSHALRTPLTAILGQTSTLLDYADKMSPGELVEALKVVDKEAARLDELIRNLLDLSRLESGTLHVESVATDVRPILQEATDFVATGAPDHTLQAVLPPALPLAQADPRRLRQVVCNLLENAVKFSSPGTTVRVEAEANSRGILVHVHDQGPGIPPEHFQHIFDRFYRAENLSTRGSGARMGLAISKGLMEAMGGNLYVVSQVGFGSTFTCTLPLSSGVTENVQE